MNKSWRPPSSSFSSLPPSVHQSIAHHSYNLPPQPSPQPLPLTLHTSAAVAYVGRVPMQSIHYAVWHCDLGLCQEKLNSSEKKKINIILLHYPFKNTCKLEPLTPPLHSQTHTCLFFFFFFYRVLEHVQWQRTGLKPRPLTFTRCKHDNNTEFLTQLGCWGDFGKAGTSHQSLGRDEHGITWLRPPVCWSPIRTAPVTDITMELPKLLLWLLSIEYVVVYSKQLRVAHSFLQNICVCPLSAPLSPCGLWKSCLIKPCLCILHTSSPQWRL